MKTKFNQAAIKALKRMLRETYNSNIVKASQKIDRNIMYVRDYLETAIGTLEELER